MAHNPARTRESALSPDKEPAPRMSDGGPAGGGAGGQSKAAESSSEAALASNSWLMDRIMSLYLRAVTMSSGLGSEMENAAWFLEFLDSWVLMRPTIGRNRSLMPLAFTPSTRGLRREWRPVVEWRISRRTGAAPISSSVWGPSGPSSSTRGMVSGYPHGLPA